MPQRATIDASDIPELRRVAEKVRGTQEPIVLRADDEDMAVVFPLGQQQDNIDFKPTEEQIRITMSAAGGWEDLIDPDELKEQIKLARGSRRPAVKL